MATTSPTHKGWTRDHRYGLLAAVYTGAAPGAAALAANTVATGVLLGTPVTPALAVDSLVISNLVASGDILLAANNGGNSQAWVWVDSSAGEMRFYGAGTALVVNTSTAATYLDGILLRLGTDGDQVLVNRATTLATNTALTSVLLGTPVTPAIAANSLILSNVTASGDILVAGNLGGNSQAWLWVDTSAGELRYYGAGTGVGVVTATAHTILDGIILRLGTDGDQAIVHRAATLAANTALTSVLAGTPVSAATPANSLLFSNVTADGDQAFFVVAAAGANSEEWLRADASARLVVFNEAGADWDLRMEGDANINLFVLDAGVNAGVGAVAIGGGAVADNLFRVDRPATTATADTSYFTALVRTSGAVTIPTGTAAEVSTLRLDEPSITATGTVTESYTLNIAGVATEGTRNFALNSAAGLNRLVGNLLQAAAGSAVQHATAAGTQVHTFEGGGTAPSGTATNASSLYASTTVMRKINAAGTDTAIET